MSEESIENSKAPLIEHFIELRKRILRSICVLSFTFLVAFIFSENIYLFLVDPYEQIMGENSQMIYTAPQEFLIVKLKIALFGSLLITFPYFCLEIYSFIAPGLYENEKKLVAPVIIFSTGLFYAGMCFAYFIVFPLVFNFFTTIAPDGVEISTDISELEEKITQQL